MKRFSEFIAEVRSINMYHQNFKDYAKHHGHTVSKVTPHGKGNGNIYVAKDKHGRTHGVFDDLTQSGYYHGSDGRNRALKKI